MRVTASVVTMMLALPAAAVVNFTDGSERTYGGSWFKNAVRLVSPGNRTR